MPAATPRLAQEDARQAAGRRWQESWPGLVFTTATGQPRSGSGIGHGLSVALQAAGLSPMRWPDLRAVYAGAMLASGADRGTVSALLGHSSVSLTLSTYAGIAPSLQHEAADRLEKWLTGPDFDSQVDSHSAVKHRPPSVNVGQPSEAIREPAAWVDLGRPVAHS